MIWISWPVSFSTNGYMKETKREIFSEETIQSLEVEKVSPEYEARHNLIGLFSILLEVDRRINPHLYEKKAK